MTIGSMDYSPSVISDLSTPVSTCSRSCNFISGPRPEFLMPLCSSISDIKEPTVRMQVSAFCEAMCMFMVSKGIGNLDALPMYPELEDDEAYYEWVFDYFRFGFCFLEDPEKSRWFVSEFTEDRVLKSNFMGKFDPGYGETVEYVMNYVRSRS
ncbi:MAG: hypothetical protein Q4Q62_07755 [Thermoplasmata archaeon]|nr:hypothetical protein [Thermoplasmata archaeon]